MRAYIPKSELFKYPEEMEIILKYLRANGVINISSSEIERYYEEFSDERYCAGWMSIDSQWGKVKGLKEFAEYLSEIDI